MNTCIALLFLCLTSGAWAQAGERDLRLFGYFQNNFFHSQANFKDGRVVKQNSFSVQQLNVFLQRDLAPKWTALVNFETLNSYSSSRDWGAFNLEEALGQIPLRAPAEPQAGPAHPPL